MLFAKTAIAILAAATLVSARPHRMFEPEMCHQVGEPCDRPAGQCCPWLTCDLGAYECKDYDARPKPNMALGIHRMFEPEMCHEVGEPCDRPHGQCCPWLTCDLANYSCEENVRPKQNVSPRIHRMLQPEMCHEVGEPCDRPHGQCCPWLTCDLGNYSCEEPNARPKQNVSPRIHRMFKPEMCHQEGEPCDRPVGQCCPWLTCNLGAYQCE